MSQAVFIPFKPVLGMFVTSYLNGQERFRNGSESSDVIYALCYITPERSGTVQEQFGQILQYTKNFNQFLGNLLAGQAHSSPGQEPYLGKASKQEGKNAGLLRRLWQDFGSSDPSPFQQKGTGEAER